MTNNLLLKYFFVIAVITRCVLENQEKYKTNTKLFWGYNLTTEDIIDVLGIELKNAARLLR